MKYCSMTTMYYSQRNCSDKITIEESLKRIARLGIKFIDLNMCAVGRFGEHQFDRDDWESQACSVRDLCENLGLEIVQTHLPYPGKLHKFDFYNKESYQHMQDCTLRAMKISNIVGAQWAVLHPVKNLDYPNENIEKQIAENHKFYSEVFREVENGCCGLAFENMINDGFCTRVEDLIELVDSYKNSKVQAAWDFGEKDDHLAPFQGIIDWDKIFSALKDVGFDGYWDFEIGKTYSGLPLELKDSAMSFYKDIADYMIEHYEDVKKGIWQK